MDELRNAAIEGGGFGLYSACASDPSDYYAVEDPAKLPNVFKTIANKFSRLQLTN